jgi:YVTN family beta-propeller protein
MRTIAAIAAICLAAGHAGAAAPSFTTRSIALGAPDRWDYLSFDAETGHVLIAHGDHTDVVDPDSDTIVGKLAPLQGAHGQVATAGAIYADSGQTGTVTAFDRRSLRPLKTLAAGKDADGMAYDPAHRVVVVMDGDPGTATLIDTATNTVRATVSLGGEPEFAAADGAGHVFINLASTSQVAVLDVGGNTVTARFDIPDCQSPHGAAMDPRTHRLFVSCKNAKLVVLNTAGGAELQSLPIGRGTDAAAFDPRRRLVFSSNGSGSLSIFQESSAGALTKLTEMPTAPGARTMAVDPATGRVFLVTADEAGTPAPGQRPTFKPGTTRLLVLTPASQTDGGRRDQ